MNRKILITAFFFSLVFFSFSCSSEAMLAFMDKDVYQINESALIKVNRTADANITGNVTSNGTMADNFTIPKDGTTGFVKYTYGQTLPPGQYTLLLEQGNENVKMNFEVKTEILKPVVRLMESLNFVHIFTDTQIDNGTGGIGGNFSDLLSLNKTPYLYHGKILNLTGDGRVYHFVAVDENAPGVYDSLYVDDDSDFRLFNDTEDNATYPFMETSEQPGGMLKIDSEHRFIVADMDTSTGKTVYLLEPLDSPMFSSSDMLYMLVLLKHENGTLGKNTALNVSVFSESKVLKDSNLVEINENGTGNLSVNLSDYSPGKYTIVANETPVDVFKVETFSLRGKVTDLSGNPMTTFAPGSTPKIWVIARDANGDLMTLDSDPGGTVTFPDGTSFGLGLTEEPNATGVYTSVSGGGLTMPGEYKIEIEGTKGQYTEKVKVGLAVKSVEMMPMTLNPKYMDEGGGKGTMVTAFAPGSNITAAVFMINMSKGSGLKSGGPPCGFDGSSCVGVSCDASQFDVVVKNDLGQKYNLGENNFSVVTIGYASQLFGGETPDEPGMKDQCVVIMWGENNSWAENTGEYKVELSFSNDTIGDLRAAETFSVKRLLAKGSTVDFKGSSFSFFAPNSTMRVKLEVRDMLTDQLLPAENIINAKFTEMWKEWPERKNVFKDMSAFTKSDLNESIVNNTIVFTSPPEEGFYTAEFRFKANVSGTMMDGTGTIFFELKKYMIWADLDVAGEEGSWFVKRGENISLTVSIMDIDMASQKGSGTTPTCTGCAGMVATVSSLRNEQFFKEMKEGTDYTVTPGVVINSTSGATVQINPINLQSGWYGLDILLNDTSTGNTYYGWGGFEIRNFWVDIFSVMNQSGNITRMGGEGTTIPVGGSSLMAVAAYSPPSKFSPPMPLKVTYVNKAGIQDTSVWPPLPVDDTLCSMENLYEENLTECFDEGCEKYPIYLINVSTSSQIKEGNYELAVSADTERAGSDIGTARMTVSSYRINYMTDPMSKMFQWPPVYANTENLTLIFTGLNFDNSPHNLTNITVKNMYSEKEDRPISFKYGKNYTNNCTGSSNLCKVDVFLSGLSPGEYFAQLEVDDGNSTQTSEFMFGIKNLIFSVPQIYEGWTRDQTTAEQTLDAWNGEDTCDNQIWMQKNDVCKSLPGSTICTDQIGGVQTNITLPVAKNNSVDYFADRMCIYLNDGGRWLYASAPDDGCPGDKFVYIAGNGSHAWINMSNNMSDSQTLTNESTFTLSGYPGITWEVNSFRQNDPMYIRIKRAGAICARNEMGGDILTIVPPAGHDNHSTFYHGPSYVVGDMWMQTDCQQKPEMTKCILNISDRPGYVYHNTTHVWFYPNATFANFTDAGKASGPVSVGGIMSDGSGGNWKVVSIAKSKVTIEGQNVLENGVMVNASLSTSGKIWLGELREDELGFENKLSEEKTGWDLDNDGTKNGTVMFVIIDSSNGYDKLAYSKNASRKWNMSEIIDVSDTRANRQFGAGSEKLILLNIDPRADRVMFYDPNATGDWPEIGDSRVGDNITIPVVVKSPDGSPISANVSIPHMKVKTSSGTTIEPAGVGPVLIEGVGEIEVNVSSLGYGAGRYEFELKAENDALGEEMLNEWLWPRSTVRNFLIDTSAGYGGIITNFAAMEVDVYGGWDSPVKIRNLFTVNQSGVPVMKGVMETIDHEVMHSSCPGFQDPADAGAEGGNKTYVLDRFQGEYYAYMTPANQSTLWLSEGDCNFTTNTSNYTEGSPVNITLGQDTHMLYVLRANMSGGSAIGLSGFPDEIEPIRMDDWGGRPSPNWNIMSMNRSGTIYNVVYANNTTCSYPQAVTWGINDVAKVVWLDTDGNFSDASSYQIGQNFTADEYVSRVGPAPWDGLVIADGSNLTSVLPPGERPGMDVRPQDNTPVYFGFANESSIGLDLDMDGEIGGSEPRDGNYMIVAYDDFGDGENDLTRIYVDNDMSISEPWWANSSNIQEGQVYTYYDFYKGEGFEMPEQEGNPPRGMWGGNIRFGPRNDSMDWEQRPEWNIKAYNGTRMIIEKNVWHLNETKTIAITGRAFDFAQNPISGANLTLKKLKMFGGGVPYKELVEGSDFTLINTQNVTDSKGYGMLKLEPVGSWVIGAEYIAVVEVGNGAVTETTDEWFMIGEKEMGP